MHGLLLYFAVGAGWVLGINHFLVSWATDPEQSALYNILADSVYVLVTGGVTWWLLRRSDRARTRAFRRTALILHHAPVGIVRADSNGQILWANERMSELTGMSLDGLCQHQFRAVVQPPDTHWSERQRERLLAGEIDHYRGERQCRRFDTGAIIPVVCTVTLVPRAAAEPAHLICVVQDISDAHAARAALERSEARLHLALEGSGSGLWDWDLRAGQGTVSLSLERLLRYQGSHFVQDFHLRTRLHRQERKQVLAAVRLAIATGQPFQQNLRLRCFDGVEHHFMVRGQRHLDAAGQPERFSGILTDLSTVHAAQERQRLASTVVDNTQEGVVVTDAQNRILSVNAAFTRVLGYTEDELLGKTPREFKSDRHDQDFYQTMWNTMHRTGHWQGEIWNRRKNGEIFPEHMSLSAVRDETGKISHYVCIFSDISEAKAQQERLEYLAHRDALTGLSNRVWFGQQLEGAVTQAQASGEHLAVLLINLDRFKDVNDSYGHGVGDKVLQHLAQQVRAALRPGDLLGRLAGDELAVVARNMRHADGAAAVARHLLAAVSQPWYSPQGLEVVVGASVGICLFPQHANSAELLLQGAHAAVYGAKARGRGALCFFAEEMTTAARERLELESRLRQALAQEQLQLHYQPQADIATGRIIGAEALLRWNDPQEGAISPARFIPVAESSGLIGPLGEWVLRQVCQQGQRWLDAGLPAITLAVNVSPRQFQLTDLVASTRTALAETGFPASQLELEITESALAERFEEVLKVLEGLQGLGLHLAVDDFGTGYSSLAHLKRFPIDVLKIDQSFIRDIPHHCDDMAISAAIIAMGHSMALKVLAEGVETQEQLAFLVERGCDSYQGYLLSRPLPAADFALLLQKQALAAAAAPTTADVGFVAMG